MLMWHSPWPCLECCACCCLQAGETGEHLLQAVQARLAVVQRAEADAQVRVSELEAQCEGLRQEVAAKDQHLACAETKLAQVGYRWGSNRVRPATHSGQQTCFCFMSSSSSWAGWVLVVPATQWGWGIVWGHTMGDGMGRSGVRLHCAEVQVGALLGHKQALQKELQDSEVGSQRCFVCLFFCAAASTAVPCFGPTHCLQANQRWRPLDSSDPVGMLGCRPAAA